MFGNYATGGAINFRLWLGREINGARSSTDGGSFGYLNNYAIVGGWNDTFEGTAFGSHVRGDDHISYSSFNTQTVNALGTYSPTPDDRFTAPKKSSRRVASTSKRVGDAVYVQGKQASTAA